MMSTELRKTCSTDLCRQITYVLGSYVYHKNVFADNSKQN